MKLFTNKKTYNEFRFDKETDFEREIVLNSKLFFGTNSIYIDAKRKIETKNLGNSIPDGFLFDFSDRNNPEFYIVEVELSGHPFYEHIFKQTTKFIGFFKNQKSQTELVEKINSIITNNNNLKEEFKKYLGEKEIYKFLKDTTEKSQNILIVIDGDKKEFSEILEIYSDTWGKMVKIIVLKKFSQKGETIYSMHPDFENIEFADIENETVTDKEDVEYNEAYHLDGVSDTVKKIYKDIKQKLLKLFPKLVYNPQKFYVSIRTDRNIAFFITARKKIRLVVLNPEKETRKEIKRHTIKRLTPSVQKFWNAPSCAIIIDSTENLNEVTALLKKLIAKS